MSVRQEAQVNLVWRSEWIKTKLDEASPNKYRGIDDTDIMMVLLLLLLIVVLPLSLERRRNGNVKMAYFFLEE